MSYHGESLGVIPIHRRRIELKEIPFQSFEIVNIEMVGPVGEELKIDEFPMASLKDSLTIINNGYLVGWGRMLELPNNKDHYGLGYDS